MVKPGKRGRRFAGAFAAASLFALMLAASAWGVAQTIVASDDFFSTASYTMDQGDRPTLQNAGTGSHNATASSKGPDGEPLFISPTIGTGSTTVNGSQYLTAGSYAFICTVHPLSMQASLTVSGSGTPTARPKVDVTISASSLSAAAKKGKLPVKVQALTLSDGVELDAKLGKVTLGTQKAFNLAAGQTRKITLKLTKAGRSKLTGRKSAKVTVTGSVPFGSPDSAKKTLK